MVPSDLVDEIQVEPPVPIHLPPLSLIIDALLETNLAIAAELIAPDWPNSQN